MEYLITNLPLIDRRLSIEITCCLCCLLASTEYITTRSVWMVANIWFYIALVCCWNNTMNSLPKLVELCLQFEMRNTAMNIPSQNHKITKSNLWSHVITRYYSQSIFKFDNFTPLILRCRCHRHFLAHTKWEICFDFSQIDWEETPTS